LQVSMLLHREAGALIPIHQLLWALVLG